MKFEASIPDVDLELTLEDMSEVKLVPKVSLDAHSISKVIVAWEKIVEANRPAEGDDDNDGDKNKLNGMELGAAQMAVLYDKPREWWTKNLTPQALYEVVQYVAKTLAAVKKKEAT